MIISRLKAIEPWVQNCYQQEMERNYEDLAFNLCFVAGVDGSGKMEFFEFSTSEHKMTEPFKNCLAQLAGNLNLEGLKDLKILQAIQLYPR